VFRQFLVVPGLHQQFPDQILDIAADIARFAELGGIALYERNAQFIGNQLDQIGLPNTRRADQEDIVLDPPHRLPMVRPALVALIADTIVVSADLGGQYRLGGLLLHDILVEVTLQLLGFHVELDALGAGWLLLLLLGIVGLGQHHGRNNLDSISVLLRKVFAQLFFQLFLIRQFEAVISHGCNNPAFFHITARREPVPRSSPPRGKNEYKPSPPAFQPSSGGSRPASGVHSGAGEVRWPQPTVVASGRLRPAPWRKSDPCRRRYLPVPGGNTENRRALQPVRSGIPGS